jgi:hypothetical protein
VKDTIAIIAVMAGLAGCRSKDSPAPTTAAREERKPPDRGQTTTGRPHEKDSDLFEEMK